MKFSKEEADDLINALIAQKSLEERFLRIVHDGKIRKDTKANIKRCEKLILKLAKTHHKFMYSHYKEIFN